MTPWTSYEIPPEFSQIAIISDIHANGPAADAVFADLPQDAYIVCLGDIVGYYTEPERVCDEVRARAHVTIRGNHDAYVIGALGYSDSKEADYRVCWTRSQLSCRSLKWLASLRQEALINFGNGKKLLLRHANLTDEVGYIYPDSKLDEINLERDVTLLLGHTHHPMLRGCSEGRILNPGSVGQPRDWLSGAAYALMDTATGEVVFKRAEYDIVAYQAALRAFGIREIFVRMLDRSRAKRQT